MIPLALTLHNFMPYRDPAPLDFSGIHVACLAGDNGAGKSALLDAMTWALWGRARTRRDDELIHQGQTEMSVEFTFSLAGNTYRVVRARKAGARGSSALDLQVQTPEAKFRTISEPTIRETEKKITHLLRLDYDTFINSSFLLQNRADEFTVKTPAERKQVLADILNLGEWEAYEERAKERIRQVQGGIDRTNAELDRIGEELAQRPRYEAELSAARAAVIGLGDQLRQAEEAWHQVQSAQRDAQYLDTQIAELVSRIAQAERELRAVESDLAEAAARADAETVRAQLAAVQAELGRLVQRETDLNDARARKQALAEEAAGLRGRNEQLGPETEPIKERVAILQKATQPQCPTCGQPLSERDRKRLVAQLNSEVETRRNQYRANAGRLRAIAEESAQVERDLVAAEADLGQRPLLQKREAEWQAALAGAEGAQAAVTRLTQRRDQWQATLATDRSRQVELVAQLSGLRAGLGDAAHAQAELERARAEERAARDRVVRAEQQIASCDALAKQREARLAERKKLAEEKGIAEELRVAFGKKGVPAMIIEAAIPEVEDEANTLLARITAGRMHVRFDTQRETVKGETVETLDIKIADELGTRPYENYSIDGSEPVCIRRGGQIAYLPIQELWRENAQTSEMDGGFETQPADFESLSYRDGQAVWLPTEVILRHPAPKDMLKINLKPGNYSVTITRSHSIFVMTSDGLTVKRGDQVRPGDWVLTPRSIPEHQVHPQVDMLDWVRPGFIEHRNNVNKPLHWDERAIWSRRDQPLNRHVPNSPDLGEFLGIAVAEASGQNTLSIAVGNNRQMAERVVELANCLFGVSRTALAASTSEALSRYVARAPGVSVAVPQERFSPVVGGRLLAHSIGNMVGHGAQNKRIPANIFNAPEETQRAFLRALIAGDGHVRVRPEKSHVEIGITTVSPGLVADTILLCRQLGMWARVEKHGEAGLRRGMRHQLSYRVSIAGQANVARILEGIDVVRCPHPGNFEGIPLELVNITRNAGQRRLKRASSDERFKCGAPIIPRRNRAQYERMSHWLRDWAVLQVASVKTISPTSPYVYDLVVPDNHSFVAGTGLILVHNSGGEQFRVNFCIRIALSKLLARRAGAQLQTLVIDEGFGQLDASGRERLVEAINAIQQDFARLLVITHVEELRDAFPARIEIIKTPQGSQINVI